MSCYETLNQEESEALDINPEGLNKFVEERCYNESMTNSKLVDIYQSLKNYNKSIHPKAQRLQDEFRKTSSCICSKAKYDFYYHNGEKKDNQMSQSQVVSIKKRKRRQKLCKSSQSKIVMIPVEVQQKMKNRITIHCLKAQREEIESYTKQLESQYSFVMKKIAKLKKNQFFENLKEKKLQQVRMENRKMSEDLQRGQKNIESELKEKKDELRRNILAHRSIKKQILLKKIKDNSNSASHQRLLSKEYHDKINESFKEEINRKKRKYLKEKKEYKFRRSAITSKIEEKKEQAKTNFRNRWFYQLENFQKVKQESSSTKDKMKENINQAIETYNRLLNRHLKY